MTKQELEELVAQQQEIIDGLYEELERAKRSHSPFSILPTSPTTPVAQNSCSNSPWPNFTVLARSTNR